MKGYDTMVTLRLLFTNRKSLQSWSFSLSTGGWKEDGIQLEDQGFVDISLFAQQETVPSFPGQKVRMVLGLQLPWHLFYGQSFSELLMVESQVHAVQIHRPEGGGEKG